MRELGEVIAADTQHAKASVEKRFRSNRLWGHVPQKDLANNVTNQKDFWPEPTRSPLTRLATGSSL